MERTTIDPLVQSLSGLANNGNVVVPVRLSVEEFILWFDARGTTDHAQFARHYPRFASTLGKFSFAWNSARGIRGLDVGAHWLHHSVLWRKAGFEVSALDLPITFELTNVQSLVAEMDIRLIACSDLQAADAFDVIADSSINAILFTEIIEHVTSNPARFWKQIHRVLAPGGCIVITTPNYYAWNGRA